MTEPALVCLQIREGTQFNFCYNMLDKQSARVEQRKEGKGE
jgi:hypothetical protein